MSHVKFVTVTHSTTVAIGDDRSFTVSRTENDGYQLEWCTRDKSNGAAVICTKVHMSEEAAMATCMGLSKVLMEVDAAQAAEAQKKDVPEKTKHDLFVDQINLELEAELTAAEQFVRVTNRTSISAVQRHFRIGYNRACRLMEGLVSRGVVSHADAKGRRHVLPEIAL